MALQRKEMNGIDFITQKKSADPCVENKDVKSFLVDVMQAVSSNKRLRTPLRIYDRRVPRLRVSGSSLTAALLCNGLDAFCIFD